MTRKCPNAFHPNGIVHPKNLNSVIVFVNSVIPKMTFLLLRNTKEDSAVFSLLLKSMYMFGYSVCKNEI